MLRARLLHDAVAISFQQSNSMLLGAYRSVLPLPVCQRRSPLCVATFSAASCAGGPLAPLLFLFIGIYRAPALLFSFAAHRGVGHRRRWTDANIDA